MCIDFQKTFDRVNHRLLLAKLRYLGSPNIFLQWNSSNLYGRTQKVRLVQDNIQEWSVIPQSSHLLFVLFINFVSDNFFDWCVFSLYVYGYADNLKLYRIIINKQSFLILQKNIDQLVKWCKNGINVQDNLLSLHDERIDPPCMTQH